MFGHDGDVPDGAARAVVESVQLPHARQARVAVHTVVNLGVDNIDYRYGYRIDITLLIQNLLTEIWCASHSWSLEMR